MTFPLTIGHRGYGSIEQALPGYLTCRGLFQHVPLALEEESSLHVSQIGFSEPALELGRKGFGRHLLQFTPRQVEHLLVPTIGKYQVPGDVIHGHTVPRRVEHGFQPLMTDGQLPAFFRQLLFDVPLPDQRQSNLLNFLARKRLSYIEHLVEQFHILGNLGQRLVRVGGHDNDLDIAIDFSHLADRFNPIDTRRHSDVDKGDGNGTVGFLSGFDEVVGFFSTGRVQQLELRQKWGVFLAGECCRQLICGRLHESGLQHFDEVVVDLLLVIDNQHTTVSVISEIHQAFPCMFGLLWRVV